MSEVPVVFLLPAVIMGMRSNPSRNYPKAPWLLGALALRPRLIEQLTPGGGRPAELATGRNARDPSRAARALTDRAFPLAPPPLRAPGRFVASAKAPTR